MNASRMTLRVGHVLTALVANGGRFVVAWEPPREVVSDEGPGFAWSMRYPPCRCPAAACPDRGGGSPSMRFR
ncbi:hypothetical protein [Streptomyces sp. NPDC048172]|uniref:hypothetical protein n=1 Tax=Streptomyces sp. NPDC048172 TaxID=3365505 RepID=UPI00371E7CE0